MRHCFQGNETLRERMQIAYVHSILVLIYVGIIEYNQPTCKALWSAFTVFGPINLHQVNSLNNHNSFTEEFPSLF